MPPGKQAFPLHNHQLNEEMFFILEGTGEMRYLAVSTKLSPEVAEYPDSGKFGVLAELADGEGGSRMLLHIGREGECLDYWEGE